MPDTKITALTAIGVVDASLDPLPIVDTSDTSMAATGTTKKISINQILGAGGAGSFSTLAASGAATLSSTLAVTGATTLTGALTANGNVTLGDALADVVTVNGSLTARNGELASSIRAAASDYAGVAFDGATTSTRVVSNSQAIGTGPFSVWSRFKVPASVPASGNGASPALWSLSDTNNQSYRNNAMLLYIDSTNNLYVFRYGADRATDFRMARVSNFVNTYAGQVVDILTTRSGNTLKIYINGTDTSYTDNTGGTPPAWGDTIVSDFLMVGAQSSVNIFGSSIYRSVLFNRALSAADVVDLIELGVNPADQWGTQTGQTSGTLVASKRYRITTYVSADSFTNVGASSNATGVEFVSTGTTPTTWTNASTLNRIGGLVDLDFTVGAGLQATDRSTNNLHGTLFGGVEFTMPKRMAVLYATTNTNGNQQMLGTLAIPTNAIIEDIVVNSTGTATVSVGNVSAGTQIVNGASVVSGRQKLTLATPFSTTGNLWVNSNSTATLQFTIFYTIAS